MAVEIVVPRLGWSMEEGVFGEWLKKDGDIVRPGDAIFVIESDKTATDVEAVDEGILHILPSGPDPGDTVTVGQLLGHLCAVGEEPPKTPKIQPEPAAAVEEARSAGKRSGKKSTPDTLVSSGAASTPGVPPGNGDPTGISPPKNVGVAITPRAARVASELGVDWTTVRGTGRGGRIREQDIRQAASETSTSGAWKSAVGDTVRRDEIPVTTIRRTIAERMLAGVHETASVTLTSKLDATQLLAVRDHFENSPRFGSRPPSVTAILVKLAGVTLAEHPLLNSRWEGNSIVFPGRIDVAVAVDTQAGLLAPVVRDVPDLSLVEVDLRIRELTKGAHEGRLPPEDLSGGTFSVSNLGMHGVDAFTPILNAPQSAILGVGRIRREPAVIGDQVVPRDMVTFSLTFDHRVIDGGPAARFLDSLRMWIEQPLAGVLGDV